MESDPSSCSNKFIEVCAYMKIPGNDVVDDTLVDKLLDFIKYISAEKKEFVNRLLKEDSFVQLLKPNEENESSLAWNVFTLKMLGILSTIHCEAVNRLLWDHSLLMDTLTATVLGSKWMEASLRVAWLQSVTQILDHPRGLMLAITKDLLSTAFECVDDSSMFVAASSRRLVTKVVSLLYESTRKGHAVTGMTKLLTLTYNRIVEHILTRVQSSTQTERQAGMRIIEEVSSASPHIVHDLVRDHNLLESLTSDVKADASDVVSLILVYINTRPDDIVEDEVLLGKFCCQLVTSNRIVDSIRLAGGLCTRLKDKQNEEYIEKLILLPVLLYLHPAESREINGEMCTAQNKDEKSMEMIVRNELKKNNNRLLMESLYAFRSLVEKIGLAKIAECLVSVLQATISDSSFVHNNFSKCIIGNSNVQRCLLDSIDICIYESSNRPPPVLLRRIYDCIVFILKDSGVKATILTKTLENLVSLTQHCRRGQRDLLPVIFSADADQSAPLMDTTSLGCIIQRRLVHIQWEIRDSCLQFLNALLEIGKDEEHIAQWFFGFQFVTCVWQRLSDSESYVRASAMATIANLSQCEVLWSRFIKDSDRNMNEIAGEIIGILQKDTEAFARRAAVDLLSSWGHRDNTADHVKSTICRALIQAMSDLDWEVKLRALDFWERQIHEQYGHFEIPSAIDNHPSHESSSKDDHQASNRSVSLLDFVNLGIAEVLYHGINDYDIAVKEKACQMCLSLKQCINETELGTHSQLISASSNHQTCSSSKSSNDHPRPHTLTSICVTSQESTPEKRDSSANQFAEFLVRTDFQGLLHENEMYRKEYMYNPLSLFSDIMLESADNNTEDNRIDCY